MELVKENNIKGIVISGTYSTGKTTTTRMLSIATGIPMVNSLSAREILTDLYPGRRFQDMSGTELMALGIKRMEERIREEAILSESKGTFISDGSVLNEWVYGTVRCKVGINPGAPFLQRIAKNVIGFFYMKFFKKYLNAFGTVATLHAKKWYTHVIHLPVEFEMDPDGHRPLSEKYRRISDEELKNEFSKYNIPMYVVTGTPVERVKKIIEFLNLPIIVPIDEAEKMAKDEIKNNREAVSQKIIEQYKEPSFLEKIKLLFRF